MLRIKLAFLIAVALTSANVFSEQENFDRQSEAEIAEAQAKLIVTLATKLNLRP